MKKQLFTLFCVLICCQMTMMAEEITEEVARTKAIEFIQSRMNWDSAPATEWEKRLGRANTTDVQVDITTAETREAFYVFNVGEGSGYVIVSRDNRMPAVLGYSQSGRFDADHLPDNMSVWLDDYTAQYEYLQANGTENLTAPNNAEVRARASAIGDKVVAPLLDCHWNQHTPYNDQCPLINGQHALTGCGATAMAQIMYYHQWPKKTTQAIPSYTTQTLGICVPEVGVTSIDWENMMPSYTSSSSQSQRDAVATLMKLCGSAVKMDYGLEGSGSYIKDAYTALADFFGYDNDNISYVKRMNYSDEEWQQMIYDEMVSSRPVMYSGSTADRQGHAFVIDGYDGSGYFHVNWGWGGDSDDYFLLSSLNGYNSVQSAIVGITKNENPVHKYAYAELQGSTLTFYYDDSKASRTGEIFNIRDFKWTDEKYNITMVVFDPSMAEYGFLTSTEWMFENMQSLTTIKNLDCLNTKKVTSMRYMFYNCSSLTSLDLSRFDTRRVTDMGYMFCSCRSLTSLDVSSFDTRNVTGMAFMFHNCNSLTSIDVSGFDTKKVTSTYCMFYNCSGLTSLDVSGFDTRNVTIMYDMFYNCSGLTSLDVSGFDTRNVTNMGGMFYNCSSLTSLDVSSFDTRRVTDMNRMFYSCNALTCINIGSNWDISNVEESAWMFWGCRNIVGQDGTIYNFNYPNDKSQAHYGKGGYMRYKDPKTALGAIAIGNNAKIDGYNTLDGKPLSVPQKGVNIVRYSDGTVRKLFIK